MEDTLFDEYFWIRTILDEILQLILEPGSLEFLLRRLQRGGYIAIRENVPVNQVLSIWTLAERLFETCFGGCRDR